MKINKTFIIILTLVLISNIFAVESENFNFPQIKLYQISEPGPPPISGPNIYIQTNPFQVYMSEIIATSSTVLSGDNPSDLPIDAVICAGEINMDVNIDENIETDQIYLALSAPVNLEGIEDEGCTECCVPQGETNNLKVVFDEEGITRYYSTSSGCFGDVYPITSGCYYSSFNEFLPQLTNVRFYPKMDENIHYDTGGANTSLICYGTIEVYVDELLFYSGPIEDYSGITNIIDVGTHKIDIKLQEIKCLYFSKRYADGTLCPNDKDAVITKYCLPSQGSTNCVGNLFNFNPTETLSYQFIVADPQIEINDVFVTDGTGTSPIVINPGESKDVEIHLFINTSTMPFNITNIEPNNPDFIFTPSTPYNILVNSPGAPPNEFEFIVEGTLEAPLTYTPGDEINFTLYFDTNNPVCNDPIDQWEVEVPIIQGPDLIANLSSGGITGIIYAVEGEVIPIEINTSNIGSLNTDNSSITLLTSDNTLYFTDTTYNVPDLNPGQSQINIESFTCPTGVNMNITFEGCADSNDDVHEINENNNCGNLTIVCDAQTNLQVYGDVTEVTAGPIIRFLTAPCVVNETQTINLWTYSNGICSENSSWTNVILRNSALTELNNTNYSVPPLPNTENPNLAIHAPHRKADTDRPFGNDWGTCIDFASALTSPFSSVTHEYSYLIEEEGMFRIDICADSRDEVNESKEGDNCEFIVLECKPPEPANLTVFCTNLEIEEGGSADGDWGILYGGSDLIENIITGGSEHEGTVQPSRTFPFQDNINLNPFGNYIKSITWTCEEDSYVSTYTIFANWTDPSTGTLMNETATCEVSCGIQWYCEDYL